MLEVCVKWMEEMVVEMVIGMVANDIYFFAHPLRVLPLVVLQGTSPLNMWLSHVRWKVRSSTAGASRENFL